MKKYILSIIMFILFSQISFASSAKEGNLTTCDKAQYSDKPMVVMYSADYCFYCKKFKPIFYHLSYNLSDKFNFVIQDITKKNKPSVCNSVDLDSIPTLYIINPKTGYVDLIPDKFYSSPATLKNLLLGYYKNLK